MKLFGEPGPAALRLVSGLEHRSVTLQVVQVRQRTVSFTIKNGVNGLLVPIYVELGPGPDFLTAKGTLLAEHFVKRRNAKAQSFVDLVCLICFCD